MTGYQASATADALKECNGRSGELLLWSSRQWEPRACQDPNPRRDGGRVVLVDSLVIFRTDRFKLLGDLWIGDLFSWVESVGWWHEKAGQYADSISPTNNPARIDCQLPTIERTPRPSSAWS
jgi:hypothetical protein